MYEYFPKEPKKKEQMLLFGFLIGGSFLYGISQIPNLPFPAILQVVSFFLFTGAVIVLSRYLLRNYAYRIEPREGFDVCDLTVTEYCGKRISVVCRISLSDVIAVRHVTVQEARSIARLQKGKTVYDYTCRISPENLYLLTVRNGEETYDLRIVADDGLVAFLQHQ